MDNSKVLGVVLALLIGGIVGFAVHSVNKADNQEGLAVRTAGTITDSPGVITDAVGAKVIQALNSATYPNMAMAVSGKSFSEALVNAGFDPSNAPIGLNCGGIGFSYTQFNGHWYYNSNDGTGWHWSYLHNGYYGAPSCTWWTSL